MEGTRIVVTEKDFKELKRLYNKAVTDKAEEFVWMDKPILTAYAKYLIEYLNSKMQ